MLKDFIPYWSILQDVLVHLPDKQRILNFKDDMLAVCFDTWWFDEGEKEFIEWLKENDYGDLLNA